MKFRLLVTYNNPMSPAPLIAPADYDRARAAARKVVDTHERLSAWLRPGMTLAEIDRFVMKTLDELRCRSCFFRYKIPRTPEFPSHACLSLNECVVHGTAGYVTRPIREGDLLKLDIGVWFEGWIGDAAWTYSIGTPTPEIRRLMDCGKECLARGIKALRPDGPWLLWAQAVQQCVEIEHKFHLVRGLGGHGIGRKLHQPPFVSNVVLPRSEWPEATSIAAPGSLVALEPMIAIGTGETVHRSGSTAEYKWPVYSADGSMTVHYEHDVLMTDKGPEVLTAGLERLNDVIK